MCSIRPDLPGSLGHKDNQRPGYEAFFWEGRGCAQLWCRPRGYSNPNLLSYLFYFTNPPILANILKGKFSKAATWGRSEFLPWLCLLIRRYFLAASRHCCIIAHPKLFLLKPMTKPYNEKIHSLKNNSKEQTKCIPVIFLLLKLLHCNFITISSFYSKKIMEFSVWKQNIHLLTLFTTVLGFYIFTAY